MILPRTAINAVIESVVVPDSTFHKLKNGEYHLQPIVGVTLKSPTITLLANSNSTTLLDQSEHKSEVQVKPVPFLPSCRVHVHLERDSKFRIRNFFKNCQCVLFYTCAKQW